MDFYSQLLQKTERQRRHLLDLEVIRETLDAKVSRRRYLAFLAQAYHHVRHTVPLLMACGSRLSDEQRWMQSAIASYIDEEQGHEEWILNDIAAAGGDPVQVIADGPEFEAEVMVAYAYYQIERVNPVSLFGMVHVLEGTSIALATRAASQIQSRLDLPDQAFSYLRSHGDLDKEHVKFFERLMNRLDSAEDRQCVIHSARHQYRLYGALLASLPQ